MEYFFLRESVEAEVWLSSSRCRAIRYTARTTAGGGCHCCYCCFVFFFLDDIILCVYRHLLCCWITNGSSITLLCVRGTRKCDISQIGVNPRVVSVTCQPNCLCLGRWSPGVTQSQSPSSTRIFLTECSMRAL